MVSDVPPLFFQTRSQWESSEYADKYLATREYKTLRRRELHFKYTQDLLSKVNYKHGQKILKVETKMLFKILSSSTVQDK